MGNALPLCKSKSKPDALIPLGDSEVAYYHRDLPPSHYILKIDSFSELPQLVSKSTTKYYESQIFAAVGYKWKLLLYPNGDEERGGTGYISMYLVIADTTALQNGWKINVKLEFFVLDQIRNKFLTIKDALGKEIRRFDESNKELGFAKLLGDSDFRDVNNGYLVKDKCEFGVEIFVISCSNRGERIPRLKEINCGYTWWICNFSALKNNFYYSDIFTAGDFKWKLLLFPKGDCKATGKFMSLYLCIQDLKPLDRVYVGHKVRIRCQSSEKYWEAADGAWFSTTSTVWGWSKFIPLSILKDESKGFLLGDTLIVEALLTKISKVQNIMDQDNPSK